MSSSEIHIFVSTRLWQFIQAWMSLISFAGGIGCRLWPGVLVLLAWHYSPTYFLSVVDDSLILALLWVPKFAIHCCFHCGIMCRIMRLSWMNRFSLRFVQAIEHWPSAVVTIFCPIRTLERAPNPGWTVAGVACPYSFPSPPTFWPICTLLRRGRIWEVPFQACAAFSWGSNPQTWSIAYLLSSPANSRVFHRTILFMGVRLRLWALYAKSCPGILAGWHTVELLAISPAHGQSHYIEALGGWQKLEEFLFLCVRTTPVFDYYSDILEHHHRHDLIWLILTS